MEGTSIRYFPRIEEDSVVEVRKGEKPDRLSHGIGNLSVGGIFARVPALPVGSHVVVHVGGAHPFDAEGIVSHAEPGRGVGIRFTSFAPESRASLDDHIADLTLRGLPAA